MDPGLVNRTHQISLLWTLVVPGHRAKMKSPNGAEAATRVRPMERPSRLNVDHALNLRSWS